jgi:hypothetical protein
MFESVTAFFVVIAFLVPGFIWQTVEGYFAYIDRRHQWERVALGFVTRSAVYVLPWSGILYTAWRDGWWEIHPYWAGAGGFVIIVAAPAFIGFLVGLARQHETFSRVMRKFGFRTLEHGSTPTAWDYVFSRLRRGPVTVTLRNGGVIKAYLGAESYFSSDDKDRDMYLSHMFWRTEKGTFELRSGGIYIAGDQIALVEFGKATGPRPRSQPQRLRNTGKDASDGKRQ